MTKLAASLVTALAALEAGHEDEPRALWQAVERASEVMGIDQDLMRPPALDAGGLACD